MPSTPRCICCKLLTMLKQARSFAPCAWRECRRHVPQGVVPLLGHPQRHLCAQTSNVASTVSGLFRKLDADSSGAVELRDLLAVAARIRDPFGAEFAAASGIGQALAGASLTIDDISQYVVYGQSAWHTRCSDRCYTAPCCQHLLLVLRLQDGCRHPASVVGHGACCHCRRCGRTKGAC